MTLMTLKEKLGIKVEPLYLMDGTAFIYRSFYAQRHLRRSDGYPTNALSLVIRVLLKIMREENPRYFLFVMDGKGPNFRSSLYPEYKANREAMPEELIAQIEPIKRGVDALGLPRLVSDGVEADDCIASLAERFSGGMPCVIISGDKDLKQCLRENVFAWDPGAKEEKIITEDLFKEETGVSPRQWPDVQALIGDSSDNIPGVAGIGPKTARQIFEICPNLEAIRDHIDELPPKLRDKLLPGLDKMFLWRELTTLRLDACPNLELPDLTLRAINGEACAELVREFELNAIGREIKALERTRQGGATLLSAPVETRELPLFPSAPASANVADLPACAEKSVAIVWAEGSQKPARVAIEGQSEIEWTGSTADLTAWLASAHLLVIPALKPALERSPSWQKLIAGKPASAWFDLGLASYLLSPEDGDYSWPRLAARWRDALGGEKNGPAPLALAIAKTLEKNLAQNGMTELFHNLEEPLTPILADMEARGIAINPAEFQSFLGEVEKELNKLEKEIFAAAGEEFNIRSSQRLGEILFDKLKLTPARKTPGGQPSTSQAALEKLAATTPLVDLVLKYRKLDKMRSTYLEPLPRLMDSRDRLHTTFNQEATATGRLSSSNPNLQNIPVRGSLGKRMRACFVADQGKLLIAADYSQIELRLLAHFSRDETLLRAFREGHDIHRSTAALVFDEAPDQVTPDQRRMAKTINFGLLYGMGAQKLAGELKISSAKAKDFIARYFSGLAGVKEFYEKVLEKAQARGYVSTLAGRRRWLPELFSNNGQAAAQARRQAINAVIQGTAADIIKLAMLAVARDPLLKQKDARLVLQIHDELLLEAPGADAEECGARVARLMETVRPGGHEISVPLAADWGVAPNWGAAH